MNSKELLEHAEQRIAEVESIRLLKKDIEDLEKLLQLGDDTDYELGYYGLSKETYIESVLSVEQYKGFKDIVKFTFEEFLHEKYSSMEKLLGIRHPAIINPEFEEAIKDMEHKVVIVHPAPELDVNPEEVNLKNQPEVSTPSRPELKKGRPSRVYPEGMTVETVRRMYIDENKTIAAISKFFGITYADLSNFISKHKLQRCKMPVKETERP